MEEITYTKAQYEELFEKYKAEVEKRAVAEANFKSLYMVAVQAGLIKDQESEHSETCNCEDCKDEQK